MTRLVPADLLVLAVSEMMGPEAFLRIPPGEVSLEPLPSSRAVYRLSFSQGKFPVVGKFFSVGPTETPLDRGLRAEYDNYRRLPALGLNNGCVPRLLGRRPEVGLGLLLEAVPGPDLDFFLARACSGGETEPLQGALASLAGLLAFFHSRPVPEGPATPEPAFPAFQYLGKLLGQLSATGLLSPEDRLALEDEGHAWRERFADFAGDPVLVHGDATPTNFLFPLGRAVALDLEKLRVADRLWDLSWVAGELKHAWGWRTGDFAAAEPAIRCFFGSYRETVAAGEDLARRLYCLNPFYMALAELRIARNLYLSWDYRRELVAEARRCLAWAGRL
jgi:hypothetical protein